MTIFRYTLNKYIKSWSTYVISGVTFLLIFLLAGFVAFNNFDPNDALAVQKYAILSVALVAGITAFLAIFTSVFAGFKAATMFKDEVEDGTFLVMLSKPVSRSKIIFEKWLALITILVIYTLFISLTFLITIMVFDKGDQVKNLVYGGVKLNTLRSQIWVISLVMWGILSVVALIFSSLALLISTKLSVGTTIGISIALGVIIPITSLVQTFTRKEAYNSIASDSSRILDTTAKALGVDDPNLAEDPESTYSLGLASGEKDGYRSAFVADVNFQINVLASFASEKAIPDLAREFAAQSSKAGAPGLAAGTGAPGLATGSLTAAPEANQGLFKDVNNTNLTEKKANLDKALAHTYEELAPLRARSSVVSAIALQALKENPNKLVPAPAGLKAVINKSLIDQFVTGADTAVADLVAAGNSNNTVNIIKAASSFILATQVQDQTSVEAIKRQVYYTTLMSEIYQVVSNNMTSFDDDGLSDAFVKQLGALNLLQPISKDITKDEIMTLLTYNSWLGSPFSLIDVSKINSAFKGKDVTLKSSADYSPSVIASSAINNYGDAVNYLLNLSSKSKTAYQEVTSMMDGGFELKKVIIKDYVNRNTLLYIYLAIVFGLVPLAYLSIRRQDFR